MNKKLLAVISIVLLVASLAGCAAGASTHPAPDSEEARVFVTGTLKSEISGDMLTLHLTTDILDGAVVRLSIESLMGENIAYKDITKSGDNLIAEFDISEIDAKSIYGFASCTPSLYGKQPKEVKEVYGKKFQNVYCKEENVIMWGDDGVFIVFSTGKIAIG